MQNNICGYGAVIIQESTQEYQEISGALPSAKTSQQAELQAFSEALKLIPEHHRVHLVTDCSLVLNTVRNLIRNPEDYDTYTEFGNGLGVCELAQQFKRLGSDAFSIEIVSGHGPKSPDYMQRSDTLAKAAAKNAASNRLTLRL
jgi:ribonuclease HI